MSDTAPGYAFFKQSPTSVLAKSTNGKAVGLHWVGPEDDLLDCQVDYTVEGV